MVSKRDFCAKTCCSCDSEESRAWNPSEAFSSGRKVLYSGVPKDDQPFRHVKGCYCGQPPVKPFLRLAPCDSSQKSEARRAAPPCGVRRVPKDAWARSKNAETQTFSDAKLERFEFEPERRDESELSSKPNLGELRKFRNDNYFDTHSDSGRIPAHKCVHKFMINERFLPEPVNADAYGISRCAICRRPLEPPTVRSRSPGNRRGGKPTETTKKIYEYKLRPPSVNIGTGKEVMKIAVPPDLERECFEEGAEFKLTRRQMAPFESLALRYQKGVV